MNVDSTIIYNHILDKNRAGEVVTYSSMLKGKVLDRSNPTLFKTIRDMLDDGTLRGEYLRSTSGHSHLALFVNEGEDEHIKHLIKRQIDETVRLRITIEGFMTGEIEKKRKGAVWHTLKEFEVDDN